MFFFCPKNHWENKRPILRVPKNPQVLEKLFKKKISVNICLNVHNLLLATFVVLEVFFVNPRVWSWKFLVTFFSFTCLVLNVLKKIFFKVQRLWSWKSLKKYIFSKFHVCWTKNPWRIFFFLNFTSYRWANSLKKKVFFLFMFLALNVLEFSFLNLYWKFQKPLRNY